jgi:hypothetical protein
MGLHAWSENGARHPVLGAQISSFFWYPLLNLDCLIPTRISCWLYITEHSLSLIISKIIPRPLYISSDMARNVVEDNWRLMSSAELPPCDGPKLQAFKHRSARIHWGDCIGGIGENGERIGSQAYLFKRWRSNRRPTR